MNIQEAIFEIEQLSDAILFFRNERTEIDVNRNARVLLQQLLERDDVSDEERTEITSMIEQLNNKDDALIATISKRPVQFHDARGKLRSMNLHFSLGLIDDDKNVGYFATR